MTTDAADTDRLSLLSGLSGPGLTGADGAEPPLADWERLAAAVLRKSGRLGADDPDTLVWEKLTRSTLDDIAVTPLGTVATHEALVTSGRPLRTSVWDNRVWFADPATTAEQVVAELERGATSIWLQLGKYGLEVDGLPAALSGVLLDAAPVVLDAGAASGAAAAAFAEFAQGSAHDGPLAGGTNLGADPIGLAVREGGEVDLTVLPEIAGHAGRLGCRAIVVDATTLHDRGASDVPELAYALGAGATYLRTLVEAGLAPADAAGMIEFRLAATDEQFPTIAKLRAARRLWGRVLQLSDIVDTAAEGAASMRVHAVTSRPMMSKYDPWVNMLRTCVAAFAAGVGGADAVTVLPFDIALGLPDAFSRRIARNTLSLLIDEAHVAKVADPAGGSHLTEKLTDDTALAAWAAFGELEAAGGVVPALPALLGRVEQIAARRDLQVARRQHPITGLSEFPNLAEELPERPPYPGGAIPVRSYGHAFEDLRDRPMAQPVFLATMGKVSAHTARATFASNLLAAGGIGCVNEGAHAGVDEVLSHYRGEAVVCLVGADPAYEEWGGELIAALREAGAQWVIVAGPARPDADDNCAMGVDALDFLNRTREKLA